MKKHETGFTIIELIVSLVLVGIMASIAGMGIVAGVRGYLFAKDNAAISGKAQLAMSRLTRTFIEVLDITTVGTSPTRVTYNRLSGGVNTQETLYLNTADNTIKIASGGSATGGDTLVDHVSNFTLTYWKGTANWVQGTDDFYRLSTVGVTLVLTRPDGGSNVTFSTVITPRNNGNLGGNPMPTTLPNPSGGGCFVATAAFGQYDHPMVLLLREFRDQYLLTWDGGRMIVRAYYAGGPYLADLIRGKVWACILMQAVLLPLVGMAFTTLHAPLALPLIFLLSWVMARIFVKSIRRRSKMAISIPVSQKGSILLALIGTMVIFSVLGAAMLSFVNSSTFNQVTSTGSTRAYYLAEGGMRYAGSQFRNAGTDEHIKDNMLESLNGHDFSMSSDGTFHLDAYPYYFKTTAIPSGTTLVAKFPGAVPSSPYSLPTSGYLKIGNTDTIPRAYTSRTLTGSNITFTMSSALTGYTATVNNVLPVGQAASTTLSRLGTLTLTSGAGAFPPVNGTFTIGTASSTTGSNPAVFSYRTRNGNALEGVTLSQTPTQAFSVSVPANAYITLMKFVNVRSTGTYAPLQASRTISYSVPIGWVSATGGGGKSQFTDKFDDLSHWNVGTGELGTHEVVSNTSTDSSNAMHVKTTYQYGLFSGLYTDRASLLTLNWGPTGMDLNQSWNLAGKYLSYDAQLKVKILSQPKYFMTGMVFRVDPSTGNSYGVSFLRPNKGCTGFLCFTDKDGIPDQLTPLDESNHDILIVLWQQTSAGNVQWLAYKTLTGVDTGTGGVIDGSGNLASWSTILVRVTEAASLGFNTGTGQTPLVGDTITGANGATARINGTPILSSGAWGGTNAAGVLTIDTLNATPFVSGILSVKRGSSTIATINYTGTSRTRDNYIRVYYGGTANKGTANSSPLDYSRLGNARITAAQTLNWPVDNVSDWAAANDAFTLVQWDGLNLATGDARLGTGSELNAIYRTNFLTTDPADTTFTSPEVGVDTWGTDSIYAYFDDFGIQTAAPGQTQGFLPAIQQ